MPEVVQQVKQKKMERGKVGSSRTRLVYLKELIKFRKY